jgi:hypothetical protein
MKNHPSFICHDKSSIKPAKRDVIDLINLPSNVSLPETIQVPNVLSVAAINNLNTNNGTGTEKNEPKVAAAHVAMYASLLL